MIRRPWKLSDVSIGNGRPQTWTRMSQPAVCVCFFTQSERWAFAEREETWLRSDGFNWIRLLSIKCSSAAHRQISRLCKLKSGHRGYWTREFQVPCVRGAQDRDVSQRSDISVRLTL
jgi:hypothetical protein